MKGRLRSRLTLWLPLGALVALLGLLAYGLTKPPERIVYSKMVGKPVPRFILPAAAAVRPGLGSGSFFEGRPKLLNIFASWCIPCIAEAPVLMKLAKMGVAIDGIAIRDTPTDVGRFLQRNGNPYRRIGSDVDSRIQFAFGSSGVPESFIIDGRGVIRFQHVGDIREDDIPEILAALKAAQ
jgi:cytochrome c biogenesis protein CcmG, thiol:disulfide interchange protein DsbE